MALVVLYGLLGDRVMAKHVFSITETLSKLVVVEADSVEEGEEIVRERYWDSKIILTGDDYLDDSFDIQHESDVKPDEHIQQVS